MAIQFKDGKILFVDGAIAMHEDCCCGCGCPCNPWPLASWPCNGLNETYSCVVEIKVYRNAGTLEQVQNCSGTVTATSSPSCGYTGTLARAVHYYARNGSLCLTITPDAHITFSYCSGTWKCNIYIMRLHQLQQHHQLGHGVPSMAYL